MKGKILNILLFSLIALLLGGCFFSPREDPTKFYILDSCNCPVVSDSFDGVIQVMSVEMPQFLNKLQISTIAEDGSINISEFNRWAELPAFLIGRVLAKDLAKALPKSTVFFDSLYMANDAVQICVVITDCIGRANGDFTFRGHWFTVTGEKFYAFEKKVSVGEGYKSYADAISECVCVLAKDMAQIISTMNKK